MEFHVVRAELLSELQISIGVIEKKHTMPILANIYILAEDNQLTLKATDLEVGIISKCPAQVVEPGEFTVNAKSLQDMLSSFTDAQVGFSMSEGSMLDLVCGGARFSIETMSTMDFPSIPECDFEQAGAIRLNVGFYRECVNKVLFSVSSDPHKYALNGALMRMENGRFNLVSTDGHRMSIVIKELGPDFGDFDVIVPRKALIELEKSLRNESEEEDMAIAFQENRIFFKVGDRVEFSRLIDGKFPDYTKAVPQEEGSGFQFERSSLLDVIRRKTVLSGDKSKLVRLSFNANELVVTLKNAERGESVDKLPIEYDGSPINVGFNVDYILEFLKTMGGDAVTLNVKDEGSQGLFRPAENRYELDYSHIIMPMRLTG